MACHGFRSCYPVPGRVSHLDVASFVGTHPSATGTHSLMNRDAAPFDEITTAAEFEATLGRLLTAAAANDVDPRGSWVYRSGDGAPDWETMVHELEKPDAE